MIIIPLNTDAPIYHWPWMSLLLIAANIGVFVLTAGGSEADGWLLRYGQGLHPAEWLFSNFIHFGVLHLIGNMIFLWTFGIVVEGKLGWWRYLLVYLLIGVLGGFTEQTAMLGHAAELGGGSGGASGCIYGLLAICIVWAPKNEMDCFVLLGYRALIVEVSILTLGGWFVALEVFWAWWGRFAMSTAMLHLIGAFWGFAIGIALLKLKWVDCENWDLFAVWNGTYGDPSKISKWQENISMTHAPSLDGAEAAVEAQPIKKKRVFRPSIYLSDQKKPRKDLSASKPAAGKASAKADSDEDSPGARQLAELPAGTRKTLERMRQLLREGKPQAALIEYQKRLRIVEHWSLEAVDLRDLAEGTYKVRAWAEAIPLLEEFVQRFPGQDDGITIKLAAVYCEVQKRPRAALKQLEEVDTSDLPADVQKQVAQIRRRAERLIEEGVLELDGRGW